MTNEANNTSGIIGKVWDFCDKNSLDIAWIKDKSLTDLDNLPDPDLLSADIIENLEVGIESFKGIYEKSGKYRILVKVIDIFGNDISQAFDVEVK